jgi:hypothetical protein
MQFLGKLRRGRIGDSLPGLATIPGEGYLLDIGLAEDLLSPAWCEKDTMSVMEPTAPARERTLKTHREKHHDLPGMAGETTIWSLDIVLARDIICQLI